MPTETPEALKFYTATATRKIVLGNLINQRGASMLIAKWQDSFVIANEAGNFFLIPGARVSEFVTELRNEAGETIEATNAPVIVPTTSEFQWFVEAGRTDNDMCDENITTTRMVDNQAAAEAAIAEMEAAGTARRGDFYRIRGPGFYKFQRPAVRPMAARPISPTNSLRYNMDAILAEIEREQANRAGR